MPSRYGRIDRNAVHVRIATEAAGFGKNKAVVASFNKEIVDIICVRNGK